MKPISTNVNWIDAALELHSQGEDYVLITVLGARGSTPRDNGTKMVVGANAAYGTIGGGHLEFKAMQIAATMLGEEGEQQKIEYFPLGPALGQCCGGSTTVLFESFKGAQLNVVLFGAGHVGTALTQILQQLPYNIHWVDCRDKFQSLELKTRVTRVFSELPADAVPDMPANSCYIIMTHNHQQDYAILEAVLQRGDARYIGLIGSQTKWRRFQMRLQHRGHPADYYQHVHCPVGLAEVPGKRPIEVAVSVAGELIALHHADQAPQATQRGLSLDELKQLMSDSIPAEDLKV
jgi:xanthine dehydrogenase accessory factor